MKEQIVRKKNWTVLLSVTLCACAGARGGTSVVPRQSPDSALSVQPEEVWHPGQLITLKTGDRNANLMHLTQSDDGRVLGVDISRSREVSLVAISPNESYSSLITLRSPGVVMGTLSSETSEGDMWLVGSFHERLDLPSQSLNAPQGESGFALRASPRGEVRQALTAFRTVSAAFSATEGGVIVFGYPHASSTGPAATGDFEVLGVSRYDAQGNVQWSLRWPGGNWLLDAVHPLRDGNFLLAAAALENARIDGVAVDRRHGVAEILLWISPSGVVQHQMLLRGNRARTSVVLQRDDTLYLAGFYNGRVSFDTEQAEAHASDRDAFVLAVDANTRHSRWLRTWGGAGPDEVTAALLDTDGSIRVFGSYNSPSLTDRVDLDPGPATNLRRIGDDGDIFDLTLTAEGVTRTVTTLFPASTPNPATQIYAALRLRNGTLALGGYTSSDARMFPEGSPSRPARGETSPSLLAIIH